jgi:S1-C subfamily serine protease
MKPVGRWFGCAWLCAVASAGLAGPLMPGDAVDRGRTKVVVLKTTRRTVQGSATGFLARPGLVVTAAHAVDGTDSITAWLNGVPYRAQVAARHPAHDLAALRLEAPALTLKPLALAPSSEGLREAEDLVILAGPSQGPRAMGEPTERLAIPARFARRLPQTDPSGRQDVLLSLRAGIRRGDSGSPVLRAADGAVVGVISAREVPNEAGVSQFAFAVPVERLHPWLDEVARRESRAADVFYLDRSARQAPRQAA